MKTPQQSQFDVDLAGLIDVLGGHLYSSPDVFVRELLQNAVDACTSGRKRSNAVGTVSVSLDTKARTVTFEDSGSGMDEATVRHSLARIGASTKRDAEEREALLGRFGIGLLAGFLVADELVVETRSVQGESLRWVGSKTGRYVLSAGSRSGRGTSIAVKLEGRGAQYLDETRLRELVSRYGRYLPVEVSFVVDGRASRISEKRPWLGGEREWNSWLLGQNIKPLVVLPVRHGSTRGLVWVADTGNAFSTPAVDIYGKGMPVMKGAAGLLPRWAAFCGAVLDGADLLPTASREDVVRDDGFRALGEVLERTLLDWLTAQGRERSGAFMTLLERQPLLIKSACCSFASMRKAVGRVLPFETTAGVHSWEQLRRCATNGVILGAHSERDFQNARALTASHGVLVVNQGHVHDDELLRLLAADEDLRIEQLTPEHLARLVRVDEAAERSFGAVLGVIRASMGADGVDVSLGRFTPAQMPAMLLTTADELEVRAVQLAERATGFTSAFLSAFGRADQGRVRLVLNLDNRLIASPPQVKSQDAAVRVVRVLYAHAALMLRRNLSLSETNAFTQDLMALAEVSLRVPGLRM
ncbi:MAG: ATP-binding protein [Archangium sp.]|nr:ATP-binding protein [Archangium sp.]